VHDAPASVSRGRGRRAATASPAPTKGTRGTSASARTDGVDSANEDETHDDEEETARAVVRTTTTTATTRVEVRSTVPFIVATACVVCVALVGLALQSAHLRATALRLASVRLTATGASLAPTTKRLLLLEEKLAKFESEYVTSVQLAKQEFVTSAELKKSQQKLRNEEIKVSPKQFEAVKNAVAKLTKSQGEFATAVDVQQIADATVKLKKSQQKLVTFTDLEKSQIGFATASQVSSLKKTTDALRESQSKFASAGSIAELEKRVDSIKVANKQGAGAGLFKRDKSPSNAQLQAIKDAIASIESANNETSSAMQERMTALEFAFDGMAERQSSFAKSSELKKLEASLEKLHADIGALTEKQGSFASKAQLQKVEVITDEIKTLQAEIGALAGKQGEFSVLSAALKDVEAQLAEFKPQKKSSMFSIRKESPSVITNKQLAAVEDAIAQLKKGQADFANAAQVATLEHAIASLTQQRSTAASAESAVLKQLDDAVSALTKEKSSFVTSSALKKELSALQSAIVALTKSHSDVVGLAQFKALEESIEALKSKKRGGGLFKKDDSAHVSTKQLAALEKGLTALTKAQSDFATAADLKVLRSAVDALRTDSSSFASYDKLKEIESKLASVASPTEFVELERKTMERVDNYIKTIPKDSKSKITKHIQQASDLWFADRTGRQDFALAPGGGRVVGHSQLSPFVGRGDGPVTSVLTFLRAGVHPKSDEWLLSPSLEPPGDCLALHSSTGYVDIRLRQSVSVDAVTLEHTNSLIAYDTHSAPRDFQVFGWLACPKKGCGKAKVKPPKTMHPLGNYTYEISRGAVQTFDVTKPHTVDHVRLFVKNNQGHKRWTCIYRFRVHGVPTQVQP
jgi:SUN domain-containing protein 1/2